MTAEKTIPILSINQKEEAEKVADIIKSLSVEEQREMLAYMQGYKAGMARMAVPYTA